MLTQLSVRDFNGDVTYYSLICAALIVILFLSFYFYSRLRLARLRFFEKLIIGKEYKINYGGLLNDIKMTLRMAAALLTVFVIDILWLIVYLSPAIIPGLFIYSGIQNETLAVNVFYVLALAAGCALLLGLLFYFCTIQRYVLVLKLVGTGKYGIPEAVRSSVAGTSGSGAAIAFFKFSLLPWYALCLWVVPAVYVIPYCRVSFELLCEKCATRCTETGAGDIALSTTKRIPQL